MERLCDNVPDWRVNGFAGWGGAVGTMNQMDLWLKIKAIFTTPIFTPSAIKLLLTAIPLCVLILNYPTLNIWVSFSVSYGLAAAFIFILALPVVSNLLKRVHPVYKKYEKLITILAVIISISIYIGGLLLFGPIFGETVLRFLLVPHAFFNNPQLVNLIPILFLLLIVMIYLIAKLIDTHLREGYFWYVVFLCIAFFLVLVLFYVITPALYQKDAFAFTFSHEYFFGGPMSSIITLTCYPGDNMINFVNGHPFQCEIANKSKAALNRYTVLLKFNSTANKTLNLSYAFERNGSSPYQVVQPLDRIYGIGTYNVSAQLWYAPLFGKNGYVIEAIEAPQEITIYSEKEFRDRIYRGQVPIILTVLGLIFLTLGPAINSIRQLIRTPHKGKPERVSSRSSKPKAASK